MNCFACKKECVMRTEKHMDDTPCSVCVWGAEVAGEWCRDCLSMDSKCHFQELEQDWPEYPFTYIQLTHYCEKRGIARKPQHPRKYSDELIEWIRKEAKREAEQAKQKEEQAKQKPKAPGKFYVTDDIDLSIFEE